MWKIGISEFFEGPLWRRVFGYGPGGLSIFGFGSTIHNSFLQVTIDYGYIGLLYYIVVLVLAVKHAIKFDKIYAACFIGIIAVSLTLSLGPSYKILWILIFMFMLQDNRKKDLDT